MKSRRGFIWPLLLVLAVVVLVAGVYVFIQSKKVSQPAAAQTADWQIYTNTQYGFSLQYPKDLELDTTNPGTFLFTDPSLNRIVINTVGDEPNPPASDLLQTKTVTVSGVTARWREFGDTSGIYSIIVDQFSKLSAYPNFYLEIEGANAKEYPDPDKLSQFGTILSTLKFNP